MVDCNDNGRTLEYSVAIGIENYLKNKGLEVRSTTETNRMNLRDKPNFEALPLKDKEDFEKCSQAVIKWLESKGAFTDIISCTVDRLNDSFASKNVDPTDIQLGIIKNSGELVFENLSIKNHHDALCHPRLPSLPQQCGIKKGSEEDKNYRAKYAEIWSSFAKKVQKQKNSPIKYPEISSKLKFDELYVPLMKNTVDFLKKHANKPSCVATFFEYLVEKTNYTVIKNETKEIIVKQFANNKPPTKMVITYPYQENDIDPRSHMLLAFNNSWKIRVRIHNASSRIFKDDGTVFATEKMDPICINLSDSINIEIIKK